MPTVMGETVALLRPTTMGGSSIVITPSSIAITAPMVLINSGGPPPANPIDPG